MFKDTTALVAGAFYALIAGMSDTAVTNAKQALLNIANDPQTPPSHAASLRLIATSDTLAEVWAAL
jgi:hypothetical protein